jgi:integrase
LAYLRIKHLDFLRHSIAIEGTASSIAGRLVEGPPKTAGSVRTVPVPSLVWDALTAHLDTYARRLADDTYDPESYVFTSDGGHQLRHDNYRGRVFGPAAKRAGIEGANVHAMRHTAATLMAANGYNLLQAGAVLGHSSSFMTSRYTKVFKSDLDGLTPRLDAGIEQARAKVAEGSNMIAFR